ncbi:hypothetical protein ANO14919_131260 [Xylariales sp. No.14919]|nr:hypothetical protein ANO14919_131260 [Xylariales sp. No.14919]
MASAYEHQPLTLPKSIRVLTLEPATSEEAPIRCSLEEVDLDNIPPSSSYEALSYVWGEKVGTIPIECHGKPLLVTPNCYDALINLRRGFKRRRLFVDAICIDQRQIQQHETEKGHQIALMGQVYFAGWYTGGDALKLQAEPGKDECCRYHVQSNWPCRKVNGPVHHQKTTLANVHPACADLFENPWFTRLWTLQEQAFANRQTSIVVCGRDILKYNAFRASLHRLCHPRTRSEFGSPSLARRRQNFADIQLHGQPGYGDIYNSPKYLLNHDSLSIIFSLQSTRSEDKIFGFYGIFDRVGLTLPNPDSLKTVVEVFEDAARMVIQQSHSLTTILRFCIRETCIVEGLPSWVPDWSMNAPKNGWPYVNGDMFMEYGTYESSKGSSGATNRAITVGEFCCPGTIVGKVNFLVFPTFRSRWDNFDLAFIEAYRQWFQHIGSLSTYCTGGSIIDAAQRTIQLGPKGDGTEKTPFARWFDLMLYPNCKIYDPEEFEKEVPSIPVYKEQTSTVGNVSAMMLIKILLGTGRYYEMFIDLMRWSNYALIVLDTGHFARGFKVCEEGDVVALLSGCDVPVALRPDGNGNYRFVTVLYVDGIMKGEAWPDDESELEEIVLV